MSFVRFRGLGIVCAVFVVAASAQAGVIADFAADFSSSSNPSGAWSYGAVASLGSTPTLSTSTSTYGPGNEVHGWVPTGTSWPTIALNSTGNAVSFGAGNAITLAGMQGLLHPGVSGQFADVRYTATSAFSGMLDVAFSGIDVVGTTTDVHVLLNGQSLFSGGINGFGQVQGLHASVNLAQGDVLDFAVGYGSNGNYLDDSTGFYATLTTSDTPEPSTFALLAAAGLIGLAVRRR